MNPEAKLQTHLLYIFYFDVSKNLLMRHHTQLDATQQVRPEPLKMPAHKTAQFARRFFIAKCNRNVAFCQPPIFPRNDPRANAEELPKGKEKPQRHRGDNGQPRAIK